MAAQISRKVAVISGYIQLAHKDHLDYVQLSRKFVGPNGILYVIVENDNQSILKNGYSFVPEKNRVSHIVSLKGVDQAFLNIDPDMTVCKTIEYICQNAEYKPNLFINCDCVLSTNPTPEEDVCRANNIECLYGIGNRIIERSDIHQVMSSISGLTGQALTDKGVSRSINRHGHINYDLYFGGKQCPVKCQYEV